MPTYVTGGEIAGMDLNADEPGRQGEIHRLIEVGLLAGRQAGRQVGRNRQADSGNTGNREAGTQEHRNTGTQLSAWQNRRTHKKTKERD